MLAKKKQKLQEEGKGESMAQKLCMLVAILVQKVKFDKVFLI